MEPLDAADPVEAESQAGQLLKRHDRAYAAHIFRDAELLVTIQGALPKPTMAVWP